MTIFKRLFTIVLDYHRKPSQGFRAALYKETL